MAMTNEELSEMEKYKSALWVNNLLSPSADGLICKLIAEVRQAIASREEVVGLLQWLKAIAESDGLEFRPGLNRQTDRLLEIVEGK